MRSGAPQVIAVVNAAGVGSAAILEAVGVGGPDGMICGPWTRAQTLDKLVLEELLCLVLHP